MMFDTRQAAQYLGLQPTTLSTWRTRGGGPRFLKLGSSVRYRLSDLDAFTSERTRTSTSDSRAVSTPARVGGRSLAQQGGSK